MSSLITINQRLGLFIFLH